jgi:hypothetical protein
MLMLRTAAELVPGGRAFVEDRAHFDESQFSARLGRPADIRQVYQNVGFKPAALKNVKNALNGLIFGFGIRPDRVAIATANHGPSSAIRLRTMSGLSIASANTTKIFDAHGVPATRNVNLPRTSSPLSPTNPNLENSSSSFLLWQRRYPFSNSVSPIRTLRFSRDACSFDLGRNLQAFALARRQPKAEAAFDQKARRRSSGPK